MTVLLVDGFDLYNGAGANTGLAAMWTVGAGTSGASMQTGRFGGQAVRLRENTNATNARRTFTASGSLTVGFAFRADNLANLSTSVRHHMAVYNSTTPQCGIHFNQDGSISAYRFSSSSAGTLLGSSSTGIITSNSWQYIEVEIVISDAAGRITVYVDGTQVLNLTSQDTKNDASISTADTVYLGSASTTGSALLDYDDFYLIDAATKLGPQRVETLYPTSDVAQGFARSTGSTNYTLVDEAQVNGDTDYVQGSNVGDVDTYGFGTLSSTPASIAAVQLSAFAEKTDATARSIALQAKSGATTSDGSNYTLAASYGKFERILATDPNTSAAWTASAVNVLNGGPKVTV